MPSTREKVRLHLKVLENPDIPIEKMVNAMIVTKAKDFRSKETLLR